MKKFEGYEEYKINIEDWMFNDAYLPYVNSVYRYEVYWGGAGSGKCFARGTKVVMFDGSLKCVEDVVVGDLLMGVDSTPRKVENLSYGTGMLYNVHQNKGIDYTVNGQHILCLKKSSNCRKTENRKQRYTGDPEDVEISVSDYLKKSNRWKRNFLGYRVAVEYPEQNVPVDPYFLGVWLGDGNSHNMGITTEDPEITKFLIDYCNEIGQDLVVVAAKGNAFSYRINGTRGRGSKGKGQLLEKFKDMNLLSNKHIPDIYLHNSSDVRRDVLAGLIDTDGSLQGNCYDVIFKNETLARQTKYLANSLGLRCSILKCNKTCTNNGMVGIYYRLNISGNTQIIPVKIERKKIIKFNKSASPFCTGISIAEAGVGEYFGFGIDGDHKFLLEDFTVTHNSYFIAQKLAIQMTMMDGRNLVVLRKQSVDCRDSCYPDIYNALVEFNLLQFWHIVEHPLVRMTCHLNGNTILFNGVDDIENIKSIKFKGQKAIEGESVGNLTDVWYEEASEEPSEDAIDELDRRMRDRTRQCRIILSFNPIFMEHWLKGWMEKKSAQAKAKYMFLRTTYKDNRFLPEDYRQMLEDYRLTNPYAYQVYALGNWGTMGQSVFDVNKISDRLTVLYAEDGRFVRAVDFMFEFDTGNKPIVDSIKSFDNEDGDTTIYEEPDPDAPYVLAFDPAGEGSDFAAAQIINNATLNQAAVFHSKKNPIECLHQIICLGYYYNQAMIVPEINFGKYELEKLLEYNYPNIYQRRKPSDTIGPDYEAKFGFRTGMENRTGMLTHLVEFVSNNVKVFNDVATLTEMTTFTKQFKKNGSKTFIGAAPGAHDDLVMAMAIALETREQQSMLKIKRVKKVEGFWYPIELSAAVKTGKMEEEEARAYMKSRKDIMTALIGDVDTYDFYA